MRVGAGVVGCLCVYFLGRASRSSGLIIGTGGSMHEGENTGTLRIDERRLLDLTERTEERFACFWRAETSELWSEVNYWPGLTRMKE